jgi:hypothetical protein
MSKIWCEIQSIETFKTLVGQRLQFYITALACDAEENTDIRRGQHGFRFFRPLDDAYAMLAEMFAEPCLEEFFRASHSVQVKMNDVDRAAADDNRIRLGQGIGRTPDVAGMPCGMQQGAGEGGFPGAEVAVKINREARRKGSGQRGAESGGAGFVIQVGLKVLHLVK